MKGEQRNADAACAPIAVDWQRRQPRRRVNRNRRYLEIILRKPELTLYWRRQSYIK